MPDVTLTDDDRNLIHRFRLQAQMDIRGNWFALGFISFFVLGMAIVCLVSGEATGAVFLAVVWGCVVLLAIQKTRKDYRTAQLVTKLATLAAVPVVAAPGVSKA